MNRLQVHLAGDCTGSPDSCFYCGVEEEAAAAGALCGKCGRDTTSPGYCPRCEDRA